MSRTAGSVGPDAALCLATGQYAPSVMTPPESGPTCPGQVRADVDIMDPRGLGLQRASRRTLGGASQGEVKQSRLDAVAGRGDTRRGAGTFQGKNVLTAIPLSLFVRM